MDRGPSSAPSGSDGAKPRRASVWWLHVLVLAGLFLANFALYHPALRLDFLSVDDPDYVQNNPWIERFSSANLKFILTQPYAANYAPANLLSYAVDATLSGGKRPLAFHLSNVLWHGWVVWMVYLLAFTIRGEVLAAAAAATLFLLHPAHVEVVAWISSRKDLVATGFAALSMACYLRGRRAARIVGPAPRWSHFGWYGGSLVAFLVASSAKQSVLLLPAVMFAWDLLVEERRDWRMVADKVPFGLITIFFGWMTWHAQPSTNQAASAFVLAGTELTNLWLLTGLGQYTLYRTAPTAAGWSLAARCGLIASAFLVWALPLLWLRARQPVRAVLCYWALIQMIPPMLLSFIVPITDRYLFLPSVGVCILVADLLSPSLSSSLWSSSSSSKPTSASPLRPALALCLLLLAAVSGYKTWAYLAEWNDPRSVWYGAHLKTRNPQVAQFLGEIYHNAGDRINDFVKTAAVLQVTNETRLAEAVVGDRVRGERLRAEWQAPGPSRTNSTAYRDQLWELAWQQYEGALARRGALSTPNLFMNRGRLLVSQGKSERAIPEFEAALALARTSSYDVIRQETVIHALRAIGTAYWHLRNYRAAQRWFAQAVDVQRKSGRVWISTLDQELQRVQALAASQP